MVSGEVPEDLDPGRGQFTGDVQRGLPAELDDHPFGLLLFIDAQDVFHGERLEIELVRGVVVGGDGLGVAVHHDGFEALVPEGKGRMDAAVVELDALADAVGAAAQDHDLSPVADRHLVRGIVGGEIIGGIFDPAHRYRFPGLQPCPGPVRLSPNPGFRHTQELGQIAVRKTVLLGLDQERRRAGPFPCTAGSPLPVPPVPSSAG